VDASVAPRKPSFLWCPAVWVEEGNGVDAGRSRRRLGTLWRPPPGRTWVPFAFPRRCRTERALVCLSSWSCGVSRCPLQLRAKEAYFTRPAPHCCLGRRLSAAVTERVQIPSLEGGWCFFGLPASADAHCCSRCLLCTADRPIVLVIFSSSCYSLRLRYWPRLATLCFRRPPPARL